MLTFLTTLAGGIVWLTSLDMTTKATAADVNELKEYHKLYIKTIDGRLHRVEGRQEIMLDILRNERDHPWGYKKEK